MDYILDYCDHFLLTPYVYPSTWPENDIWRQFLSLTLLVIPGGFVIYLLPATLSYFFVFDHNLKRHKLFLKNQIKREISCASKSIPIMGILSNVIFLFEVRGHSRLYDNVSENRFGYLGVIGQAVTFILFTDTLIYWAHRWLHSKYLYQSLHKIHHTWKVPTPFASHAFHPVDGFVQSVPYHIYVFLFPMHKLTYLILFVFVNFWTVSIHDGDYRVPALVRPIINGSAHHMDHHLFYNYNYGQFFTFWDRINGSFRNPSSFEGKGPMDDIRAASEKTKAISGITNRKQVAVPRG